MLTWRSGVLVNADIKLEGIGASFELSFGSSEAPMRIVRRSVALPMLQVAIMYCTTVMI